MVSQKLLHAVHGRRPIPLRDDPTVEDTELVKVLTLARHTFHRLRWREVRSLQVRFRLPASHPTGHHPISPCIVDLSEPPCSHRIKHTRAADRRTNPPTTETVVHCTAEEVTKEGRKEGRKEEGRKWEVGWSVKNVNVLLLTTWMTWQSFVRSFVSFRFVSFELRLAVGCWLHR